MHLQMLLEELAPENCAVPTGTSRWKEERSRACRIRFVDGVSSTPVSNERGATKHEAACGRLLEFPRQI